MCYIKFIEVALTTSNNLKSFSFTRVEYHNRVDAMNIQRERDRGTLAGKM